MKKLIRIFLVLSVMLLPVAGCEREEKKAEFKGFSRMVKERHDHRQRMADGEDPVAGGEKRGPEKGAAHSTARKRKPSGGKGSGDPVPKARPRKGKTTSVQKVIILTAEDRRMLGRGIVYLDERGKIIGIRVH